MKPKHKKLIALFIIGVLIVLPVWYYNNFSIRTVEETVLSNKIDGEIKIAVISDLHAYEFGKDNKKIINSIREMSPDLIFYLGDIYSRGQISIIEDAARFLGQLGNSADVYVVTGDHDTDEAYKQKLRQTENVTLLDYKKKDITVSGNKLSIYGIDNVYYSATFDLINEFSPPQDETVNILLSHIPEIGHFGDFGFDFIFCGDTHGGMVRLPFFDGLYYKGYMIPKLTYKGIITDKGLYKFDDTSLFVTSGLGNYPLPLRFNNRPEICLITIKGE